MGNPGNKALAKDLVALPWQFSAVLAIGGFAGVRWVLPGFLPDRNPLAGLKGLCEPVSWIVLVALGFTALMAALRKPTKRPEHGRKLRSGRQHARARVLPIVAVTDSLPVVARRDGPAARPQAWSTEALRMLEWKRFELLCARYYAAVGFQARTLAAGPDGGIDVKLFKHDPDRPLAIVQCKAWNTQAVGVKEIRELLGVMVHEKVSRGIFITTGSYSPDALQFGTANPIQLLDGDAFAGKILQLPAEKQQALLDFAFEGDYRTPTCASCGVKMLARDSKRGPFWGCVHYPRCKNTLAMRA